MLEEHSVPNREPIAIIGIGCRFPGNVSDAPSYWSLLCNGTCAITEVPEDRWHKQTFYDPHPQKLGKTRTYHGGFIRDIDQFDASFFRISPREADCLDPQQRLLLEVTWEALEDAGIVPDSLAQSNTGVFIGGFTSDYKQMQFDSQTRKKLQTHSATGASLTMLANRISYMFDWCGPSITIDTACSSSLVAVHLACTSLREGESSLAIAGGVNIMIGPDFTIAESKGGFLSPTGQSRAFDADANGYVRAEGAGIVLLKPLSQALADGNTIYALIRGTGVNQDGHTNGITVPNGLSQEKLMRSVYQQSSIPPESIHYIEAHGTGTPIGDPIEFNAIGTVLSSQRSSDNPCFIGSVKTNIGHSEAAAGVAGLIKATLSLQHRLIPPHINLTTLNPAINYEQYALRIPTEVSPWPASSEPARAAVNSFGFGGTNAHVVLEEAPAPKHTNTPSNKTCYPLVFSARSPQALHALLRHHATYLHTQPAAVQLSTYGSILSRQRTHHAYRLAILAAEPEECMTAITTFLAEGSHPAVITQSSQPTQQTGITFVYSGMGPQWWGMARELLQQEPVFRATIERCDQALHAYTGWSLLSELLASEQTSHMHETAIAQPANFALQVALTDLWASWGITPAAIVGHSAGEVAAAYVAGALSWEDAIRVIFHRSRLQQQTTGQGGMLAVQLSHADALTYIQASSEPLSIAAINSPHAVTLVGEIPVLEQLAHQLEQQDIFCRFLKTSVPYHSHYMQPLQTELLESLANITPQIPAIPLFSTVTGQQVQSAIHDASYWWQNVREPVLFAHTMQSVISNHFNTLLELSPHPVLGHSIRECLDAQKQTGHVLASLKRKESDKRILLTTLSELYTLGYAINWDELYDAPQQHYQLPTYPWQREQYWHEAPQLKRTRLGLQEHPILGYRLPQPQPSWSLEANQYHLSYLSDHHVHGTTIAPGALYMSMALEAANKIYPHHSVQLQNIQFHNALFLKDEQDTTLHLAFDTSTGNFTVSSTHNPDEDAASWTQHASLQVRHALPAPTEKTLDHWHAQTYTENLSHHACYQRFQQLGFSYGAQFQGITTLQIGAGVALSHFNLHHLVRAQLANYQLHPVVLDLCFQTFLSVLTQPDTSPSTTFLPVQVESIQIYAPLSTDMWCSAQLIHQSTAGCQGDMWLFSAEGALLAKISGLHLQVLEQKTLASNQEVANWLYQLHWQPCTFEQLVQEEPGSWLIFADQTGWGARLANWLKHLGHHCTLVHAADKYHHITTHTYTICPTQASDYQLLLTNVIENAILPLRGIIHAWSLDILPSDDMTTHTLLSSQHNSTHSALYLIQALAYTTIEPRLWFVTQGSQHPVQSPLWGFARCVQQEFPQYHVTAIDLDPASTNTDELASFHLFLQSAEETMITLRQGQSYVARLQQLADSTEVLPPHFHAHASYLLTGGLGALGLITARWLIQHGARHLILISRTKLVPRSQWHKLSPDDPQYSRIQAILALEHLGATIHLATLDIADEHALATYLTGYEQEGWPPIRGVIHTAGEVHDRLTFHMNADDFAQGFVSKAAGAWALHTCFKEKTLDFFLLYSSVHALLPFAGQSNYAAANAFLDALAYYRRSCNLPAMTINWGAWHAGMVAQLHLEDIYHKRGLELITPEQGMHLLSYLIASDKTQVAITGVNWPLLFDAFTPVPALIQHLDTLEATTLTTPASGMETIVDQQQLLAYDSEQLHHHVTETLRHTVSQVLRIDPTKITTSQGLTQLGIDSMMALELKNRLEKTLPVSISVIELLQGLSLNALTDKMCAHIQANAPITSH